MNTNEFLKLTLSIKKYDDFEFQEVRPAAVMADGFIISIQASECHYCNPRYNGVEFYSEVELGFPSASDDLILRYAEKIEKPTETVYGYVPVVIVDQLIEKHGDIVATARPNNGKWITTAIQPNVAALMDGTEGELDSDGFPL